MSKQLSDLTTAQMLKNKKLSVIVLMLLYFITIFFWFFGLVDMFSLWMFSLFKFLTLLLTISTFGYGIRVEMHLIKRGEQ